MFDTFTISSREADIAYMEASDLFALSIDEGFITSFTEASEGEKTSKSGSKIVETVKNLAEKILKFFQDFFDSAKAKLLGNKIKENPKALENKKAEVLDLKKIMLFRKSYKKKIESAKTVEEVDAIVSEYEKKNKVAAVATVSTALATIGGFIVSGRLKEAGDKMVKDLQDECQSKFIKYTHDSFELVNNKGTSENAVNYVGSKNNLEAAQNEREKKTKYKDGKLVAKKGYALQKLISDDMKSVKDHFTSAISAVSNGFKGAVQNAKDKKTMKEIDQSMSERKKKGLFKENDVEESADEILGDDFSSFEESFDDLTFFGEELFEESALSTAGKKISDAIKILIEKIKKFYNDLKAKVDVAKVKAVLGCKAAKSNIKIKFAINDKNITKTVGLHTKAYNSYLVEVKKIEKKFLSGKITIDQFDAEAAKKYSDYLEETARINSMNSSLKANPDAHEARVISEYLMKLNNYQDKVLTELNKSIDSELTRLQNEAEQAEKIRLANRTTGEKIKDGAISVKNKIASAYANANKKTVANIIAAIGFGAALAVYASKINSVDTDSFTESADEISGMFAEAAEIGSEDAFFGEEIWGKLGASGDTEF